MRKHVRMTIVDHKPITKERSLDLFGMAGPENGGSGVFVSS